MTGTFASGQSTPAIQIPRLQAHVNHWLAGSPVNQLYRGKATTDPTAEGFYDWRNPTLTLFTRNMTQEIADMNPVIVLERWNRKARNARKGVQSKKVKRWTIPGNSSNNGLQYHGGRSDTQDYANPAIVAQEIPNFTATTNVTMGYATVASNYELPVGRFCQDKTQGTYFTQFQRAIPEGDYNRLDRRIKYTDTRWGRAFYMKFRLSLAVLNPEWTQGNHLNKWIFGEGQTIIVEPKLQYFDLGAGLVPYYINWMAKVVN